jgi:Metallo-beta-lactamase superfamily
VLAQQPAARVQTLSDIYRNSGDIELQNKVAPFKVFDNLYHVGPGYVDAWLIPTSAGIIMIDTSEEPFVGHVIDNIRTLGFDLKDIKYILVSHGHLDHFGGAARIQEASGARVGATDEDWQMIEQVGRAPGRGGGPSPRVPKRDMVIKEGDTLTLGATTLKFHLIPVTRRAYCPPSSRSMTTARRTRHSGKAAAGHAADFPVLSRPWRRQNDSATFRGSKSLS